MKGFRVVEFFVLSAAARATELTKDASYLGPFNVVNFNLWFNILLTKALLKIDTRCHCFYPIIEHEEHAAAANLVQFTVLS